MTTARLDFRRLWVLMVTAFVDMIGFALVLPLLPFYATEFGADATTVGLLMAAFALAQMMTSPIWGRFSDRYGRRPMILLGQGLSAIAFVVFAFADSIEMLFVCRFFQGAGAGILSVTGAYVADAVGPEARARALGWISACTSAGVMIGPAIASVSVQWSSAAPGLIAASFCAVNMVFAWLWLPESRQRSSQSEDKGQHLGAKSPTIRTEVWQVFRRPGRPVATLIWIYAGAMMAFMGMNGILALFLAEKYDITESSIGWFYFGIGLVSVVMRAILLGPLVARFGEVRLLRLGATILAMGMAVAPFALDAWQFMAAILCIPIGTALLFPSTTSLISRYSEPEATGQSLGVQQAFGGASRLIGPIWAGAIFQFLGSAYPFWISSLVVAMVAMLALRLTPGRTNEKSRL